MSKNYVDVMTDAFQDELQKIAAAKTASGADAAKGLLKNRGKLLATAAGGAAVYESARRANEDRRLGRQIRLSQGG